MVLAHYRHILAAHEQEYRDSNGADCQAVVQIIVDEIIEESNGSLDAPTIKGLNKVSLLIQLIYNPEVLLTWNQRVNNWYGNHKTVPTEEDESALVLIGTHWNHRLVVQQLFRDDIASRMKNTSLTPKHPGWIKAFQLCVTEVIASLGGDEVVAEKYGEMAKAWNEVEPPQEVQKKVSIDLKAWSFDNNPHIDLLQRSLALLSTAF